EGLPDRRSRNVRSDFTGATQVGGPRRPLLGHVFGRGDLRAFPLLELAAPLDFFSLAGKTGTRQPGPALGLAGARHRRPGALAVAVELVAVAGGVAALNDPRPYRSGSAFPCVPCHW